MIFDIWRSVEEWYSCTIVKEFSCSTYNNFEIRVHVLFSTVKNALSVGANFEPKSKLFQK